MPLRWRWCKDQAVNTETRVSPAPVDALGRRSDETSVVVVVPAQGCWLCFETVLYGH